MTRFEQAVARFEEVHRQDPREVTVGGEATTHSLAYHSRVAGWVERLAPEASDPLRLAARCQHIRRWASPRSDYPMDRRGYKRWRSELAKRQAGEAEAILRDVGYGDEVVARVRLLLLKKGIKADADVQLLEDAVCLVFLEHELAGFAQKHAEEKLVTILQKTWIKMSEAGHAAALQVAGQLADPLRDLVTRAIGKMP